MVLAIDFPFLSCNVAAFALLHWVLDCQDTLELYDI